MIKVGRNPQNESVNPISESASIKDEEKSLKYDKEGVVQMDYMVQKVPFTLTYCGPDYRAVGQRGFKSMKSHHPYDNTEYHWARAKIGTSNWTIYLNGKKVGTLNTENPEDVAKMLLQYDKKANLTPDIDKT